MAFSSDDIEIKEFVPTMRGYDRAEVRAYLRAVAEDVRRLEEKLAARAGRDAVLGNAPVSVGTSVGPKPVDARTIRSLEQAVHDLTESVAAITQALPRLSQHAPAAVTAPPRAQTPPISGTTARSTTQTAEPGPQHAQRSVAPVPPANVFVVSSTYAGPERRRSTRPWSPGESSAESTGSSAESSAESSQPKVAQHVSDRNRELISQFLPKVLGQQAPQSPAPLAALIELPTVNTPANPSARRVTGKQRTHTISQAG